MSDSNDINEFLCKVSHICAFDKVSGEKIVTMVFKTSYEMIKDRGYEITQRCSDFHDMSRKIKSTKPILQGQMNDEKILVFIVSDEKIGVKLARQIIDENDGKLVIISIEGPTAFTKKEITSQSDNSNVTFFTFAELINNISKHKLVPEMKKLTPEEKRIICQEMNVKEENCITHFPNMLREDPIRKYFDYQKGDLIEIKRKGLGYEGMMYYRCVT